MKRKRKGFTLVELLVVIAILAVLATVSILGYSSFVKKASISNDQAIIQQMNLILFANESGENKARYPHEAVEQCIENGFIWENLTPSYAENHFAYDQDKNRFMLLDENYEFSYGEDDHSDIEANAGRIFIVVGNDKDISNAKTAGNKQFGLYLRNTFEYKDEIVVSVSIDTGIAENIEKVKYETDASQSVVIHTNSVSTTLTIAAPNSDVVHYGKAGAVVIESVKPASYEEKGQVSWLELTSGRVVLTSEADVTQLHIATESANTFANKAIIAIEEGVSLPEFSRDKVVIASNGTKVCTVEKENEKKDVYLFNDGIYEQIKVQDVSSTNLGEKEWIDQSDSSYNIIKVANDIANAYGEKKHFDAYTVTFESDENRTLSAENKAVVKETGLDISTKDANGKTAKDKAKESTISKAIQEEVGGIIVNNCEELQNALDEIYSNKENWNTPIVIVLAAGTYDKTKIRIKEYPEWNGVYGHSTNKYSYLNPSNALTEGTIMYGENMAKNYEMPALQLTIKGSEGTIFNGCFEVWGFGETSISNGFELDKEKVYINFENIQFGSEEITRDDGWYPIIGTGSSSNITIKNCSFINTARLYIGMSALSGGYSFGFSMSDCTFKNTDFVMQGYVHGSDAYMFKNITAIDCAGFFIATDGATNPGSPIKFYGCNYSGTGPFIRLQQPVEVKCEQCTINISTPEDTNASSNDGRAASILAYRKTGGGSVEFDNCVFKGYKQILFGIDKNSANGVDGSAKLINPKDENGNCLATSDFKVVKDDSKSVTFTIENK